MTPGEALTEFFPLYNAKDYEGAAAVARQVLDEYPDNGLALFNLACAESLLGAKEDALAHVAEALDAAPSLKENARTDEDLAALREDPRFQKLIELTQESRRKEQRMAVTTFTTLSLEESLAEAEERDGRRGVAVRRELDIGAFGVNAARAARDAQLIQEHDELGPGADQHEELYFVSSGRAEFTVDGETIDAPAGTFVFVRDPEAKRAAVAKEDATTLVMIGARRGHAFRVTPGEAMRPFFARYNDKDYEGAAAAAREMLEEYPGNGLGFYNLACVESLLGRTDEAFEHLAAAIAAAPRLKENARSDEDFAAIRNDARFEELVA